MDKAGLWGDVVGVLSVGVIPVTGLAGCDKL